MKVKMSKSLIQEDKKGEIELIQKLSDDFGNLLLSENYSDVTFCIENEKIPCKHLRTNNFGGKNS